MYLFTEVYQYFAKFPAKTAVEALFVNKGTDFTQSEFNTLYTTLQSTINAYATELIPEIKNYFIGTDITDLKNASMRAFNDLALIVMASEIRNDRNTMDVRSGEIQLRISVVYQYSAKSFGNVEELLIMDMCNKALKTIEEKLISDEILCNTQPSGVNYPITKFPVKLHNYIGLAMDSTLEFGDNSL